MDKICNSCHKGNSVDVKFCRECGKSFIDNRCTVHKKPGPTPIIPKCTVTYTCWIGNVSNEYSKEVLEKHFRECASKFGNIDTIHVKQSKGQYMNLNQCFINFSDKASGELAVKTMDGAEFDGLKLKAELRINDLKTKFENQSHNRNQIEKIQKDPRSQSFDCLSRNKSAQIRSRDSSISNILNKNNNNNNCSDSEDEGADLPDDIDKNCVIIKNSKYLEKQLKEKVQKLKDKYPNSIIEIDLCKNKLRCKVTYNHEKKREEVLSELKKLIAFRRNYKLKRNEIKFVNDVRIDLIKVCGSPEAFINIKDKKSILTVYSFDKLISNSVLEKVKRYVDDIIELKEEKVIDDNFHYEVIKDALQNRNFLKRNGLEKLKFEFEDPIILGNKISCGKVISSGQKSQFTKTNLNKFFEVHCVKEEFSLHENISKKFIKDQLQTLKRDLQKRFLILKYSENNLQIKDCFELYGIDQLEVNNRQKKQKNL